MANAGPFIAIAAVALAIGAAGGKKRRKKVVTTTYEFEDEEVQPEGGSDPPPGGTEPVDGGAAYEIVNLLNESPPEKRIGSRMPWAVVLHQMGFSRGSDPYRYRKVTAHYIILPDGTIAQLHPVTTKLAASSGFNEGGIAIEFAGNFPAVSQSTDPDHFWRPLPYEYEDKETGEIKQHPGFGMDQLTPEQATSGRWLVEYLNDVVLPDIGGELTVMVAHRQSGKERQNDPGPDVWGNVGQWGVDYLGLSDGGPNYSIGNGNPIKQAWRDAPLIG